MVEIVSNGVVKILGVVHQNLNFQQIYVDQNDGLDGLKMKIHIFPLFM